MIENSALDSIVDVISPDDFCRRDHKLIYENIMKIVQLGQPADCVTVFEALKSSGLDAEVGRLRTSPNSRTMQRPPRTSAATPRSCTTRPFSGS